MEETDWWWRRRRGSGASCPCLWGRARFGGCEPPLFRRRCWPSERRGPSACSSAPAPSVLWTASRTRRKPAPFLRSLPLSASSVRICVNDESRFGERRSRVEEANSLEAFGRETNEHCCLSSYFGFSLRFWRKSPNSEPLMLLLPTFFFFFLIFHFSIITFVIFTKRIGEALAQLGLWIGLHACKVGC